MLATTTLTIALISLAAALKYRRQLEIIVLDKMCRLLRGHLSTCESLLQTCHPSQRDEVQWRMRKLRRDIVDAELNLLKAVFPRM